MIVTSVEFVARMKRILGSVGEIAIRYQCERDTLLASVKASQLKRHTTVVFDELTLNVNLNSVFRSLHDEAEASRCVTTHQVAHDTVRLQLIVNVDTE